MFKTQQDKYRHMLVVAKTRYYNRSIVDCGGDQKALFGVIDQLMHRRTAPILPQHSSELDLAYGFSDFFINKIGKIRDGLQSGQSNIEPVYGTDKCTSQLSTFDPATLAEVSKIIKRSPPPSPACWIHCQVTF